jgi:hypothetical protein
MKRDPYIQELAITMNSRGFSTSRKDKKEVEVSESAYQRSNGTLSLMKRALQLVGLTTQRVSFGLLSREFRAKKNISVMYDRT